MSSRRLPGKVLRDLAGAPLIERVLRRARRIQLADDVVVATSDHPSDDPIVSYCLSVRCPVYRGPLINLADRLLRCATKRGWTHFARVNADSPFVDPALIDEGLDLLLRGGLDWVTNVLDRTYPYGVAVEAYALDALRRGIQRMTEAADLEHVSPYFVRNQAKFAVASMTNPDGNWSEVRLTVDDESDLFRLASLMQALGGKADQADTQSVVASYESLFETTPAA